MASGRGESKQLAQRGGLVSNDLVGGPSESLEMAGQAFDEGPPGGSERVDGRDGIEHAVMYSL